MPNSFSITLFAHLPKPDKVHAWEILVAHLQQVTQLLVLFHGVLPALLADQMYTLVSHHIVHGLSTTHNFTENKRNMEPILLKKIATFN